MVCKNRRFLVVPNFPRAKDACYLIPFMTNYNLTIFKKGIADGEIFDQVTDLVVGVKIEHFDPR